MTTTDTPDQNATALVSSVADTVAVEHTLLMYVAAHGRGDATAPGLALGLALVRAGADYMAAAEKNVAEGATTFPQTSMQPTEWLNSAARFFWVTNKSDWVYHPSTGSVAQSRTSCAASLANAELAFRDAEAYASWSFKVVPQGGATCDRHAPLWFMRIEDSQGQVMASQSCVDSDSADKRRLVRAMLSLQLLKDLHAAVAAELDD